MFKVNIDENTQRNINNKEEFLDALNTYRKTLSNINLVGRRKVNKIINIFEENSDVWFDVLNKLSTIENVNGFVMKDLIDAIEVVDDSLIKVE